ncbi:ribose transport system substrate-binding protein [Ruminiclostridium sufflavum DSM 19573]|uniref:Ribose transport system substrate-binding protein n=1 Tax=Ruminiclostridium sufflavum DSM 19573 TaxID=1121337 RepID=A0A318XRY5_9FIRM|nr:sugar ABC transporter substrate-binding protein [Ruminiclostridium sufflavum]PYG90274.1 ribose transport system substrate-binding protein [Ruminiclostridium sufflavum DSM 19573]
MKKITAFGLIFSIMVLLAACGTATDTQTSSGGTQSPLSQAKTVKVGFSAINLSDPVVAQFVSDMKSAAKEKNMELSVNDSKGDPSTQISAVENFVQSGCNVIVIQALDPDAMEPVVKEAMSKGIKVISYGIGLKEYDVWYKNDNASVGQAIGKMAGEWINKNCNGSAKVALIEYPTVPVLIERAKGIEDALKETAPGAEIVARGSAIDSEAGMKLGETFLQKNSDIKVIVSISDGPALGAYEAVKVAGRDKDDFAIFGSDVSQVAIEKIIAGTCYRGTVDCDSKINGKTTIDIADKLMKGEKVEKIIVMGANQVTKDNAAEYKQ